MASDRSAAGMDEEKAAPKDKNDASSVTNHPASQPGDCIYPGSGTVQDPYVVDWVLGDSENPFNWSNRQKWLVTFQVSHGNISPVLRLNMMSLLAWQVALSTWTVAFCSSAYTGGLPSIVQQFHTSDEVAILGVSLYVLGFGLGYVFSSSHEASCVLLTDPEQSACICTIVGGTPILFACFSSPANFNQGIRTSKLFSNDCSEPIG